MPNIRVEYTKEGEEVIIDRDVSDNNEIQRVFDDIGQLIGLPSKGLRQSYDSLYDDISIDIPEIEDDQFSFSFYEEGSGQTSSPFEAVVADQVEWNEKTKKKDYAPNQDFYITDKPSQPTLRVDSDTDGNFYYNGT